MENPIRIKSMIRMETDVAFGLRHGCTSVFVTSGVHSRLDCEQRCLHPDLIIDNLLELV